MRRAKAKLPQEMDPYGDVIEAKYQLPSIMKICSIGKYIVVARLLIQPQGQKNAERIITVQYAPTELKISAVRAGNTASVRSKNLLLDAENILIRERAIGMIEAFKFFMDCEELLSHARNAPSCASGLRGGTTYRHRVTNGSEVLDVQWINPQITNTDHRHQFELLKAYKRLLRNAGLRDFAKDL